MAAYERHAYEMAPYEKHTYERCPYERHAYEMADGRDTPMRWPMGDARLWETSL
jgi:hypothetical protein